MSNSDSSHSECSLLVVAVAVGEGEGSWIHDYVPIQMLYKCFSFSLSRRPVPDGSCTGAAISSEAQPKGLSKLCRFHLASRQMVVHKAKKPILAQFQVLKLKMARSPTKLIL